jgi:Fe-S cluster biogenesis protein NfuA
MNTDATRDRSEIDACLDRDVRPSLRGHAGDVRIVSLSTEGDVGIEFLGACRACPLQPVTFYTAVRARLLELKSVRSVHCDAVRISTHAMRRLSALMGSGDDAPPTR